MTFQYRGFMLSEWAPLDADNIILLLRITPHVDANDRYTIKNTFLVTKYKSNQRREVPLYTLLAISRRRHGHSAFSATY